MSITRILILFYFDWAFCCQLSTHGAFYLSVKPLKTNSGHFGYLLISPEFASLDACTKIKEEKAQVRLTKSNWWGG